MRMRIPRGLDRVPKICYGINKVWVRDLSAAAGCGSTGANQQREARDHEGRTRRVGERGEEGRSTEAGWVTYRCSVVEGGQHGTEGLWGWRVPGAGSLGRRKRVSMVGMDK